MLSWFFVLSALEQSCYGAIWKIISDNTVAFRQKTKFDIWWRELALRCVNRTIAWLCKPLSEMWTCFVFFANVTLYVVEMLDWTFLVKFRKLDTFFALSVSGITLRNSRNLFGRLETALNIDSTVLPVAILNLPHEQCGINNMIDV